ncbi:hypothetical protein SAMN05216376_111140 [Mameliella alba]|nr:hypothetical protein LX94_03623 [Mameliella alba]SDD76909.1 hypothetical protein SAMN05216376_111140 [Mameliella alba]
MHDKLVDRMKTINKFHTDNVQAALDRHATELTEAETAFVDRQSEAVGVIATVAAVRIGHAVRGEAGATDNSAIEAEALRLKVAEEAYSKAVNEATSRLKRSLAWSERERAKLLAEDLANIDATMPRSPTAPGEPSGKAPKSKEGSRNPPFVPLPLVILGGLILVVLVAKLN